MAIVVGTDVVVGSSVVGYSVVGFSVVGSSGVGVVGSCVVDSSVAVVGPCVVGSSVVGLSVSGVVGKDVVAVGAAVVCEAADQSSNLKTRTTRKSVRPTITKQRSARVRLLVTCMALFRVFLASGRPPVMRKQDLRVFSPSI